MRLTSDEGVELNAEYSVEADGDFLGVVLESAGGRTAAGTSRNRDYVPALHLLLSRLRVSRGTGSRCSGGARYLLTDLDAPLSRLQN